MQADGIRDSHVTTGDTSHTPIPASQCLPLPEEEDFEEDDEIFSAAEGIMADMSHPARWQGREGEGGGGGKGDSDTRANVEVVSGSNLHEASFDARRESKGRKRPHPSDHEL